MRYLFEGGVDDMTRNEQETVELLKEPVTSARSKKIKDRGNRLDDGMVAFTENFMRSGLWSKM